MIRRYSKKIILLSIFLCSGFVCAANADALTKVACIGDSITFGHAIKDRSRNSFPAQLETILGQGYAVKNFGVSAATLLKDGDKPYWNLNEFKAAQDYQPNLVIIKLGTNDTKPGNWKHKEAFLPNYAEMVRLFQGLESQPAVWICYPIPVFPERWGINDQAVRGEVIPLIDQVVIETGAGVIDLYHPLEGRADLVPDKVHPNAAGAKIIAETIAEALKAAAAPAAEPRNILLMDFNDAQRHGTTMQVLPHVISHWSVPGESFRWTVEVPKAGVYLPGGDFAGRATSLRVNLLETGQSVDITCPETSGWGLDGAVQCFAEKPLSFDRAGTYTLEFKPADPARWQPVNIHAFGLVEGANPPTRRLVERMVERYDAKEWAYKKTDPRVYWKDDSVIPHQGRNPLAEQLGLPLAEGGFQMEGDSVWCPSIIKVGDTYHMFASHWSYDRGRDTDSIAAWTSGNIVRATSKDLLGPYVFEAVVLDPRPGDQYYDSMGVHNPKITRHDGKFVLYYIMIPSEAYRNTQAFRDSAGGFQMGIATADRIEGPWQRCDAPVAPVNNPALCISESGSVVLLGKDKTVFSDSGRAICRLLSYEADSLFGDYKPSFGLGNSLPNGYELEDPCLWYAGGQYNMLVNDWKEASYMPGHPTLYYFSKDGKQFHLYSDTPVFPSSNEIEFADGSVETFLRMERPNVYVNEAGEVEAFMSTAVKDYQTEAQIVVWPVDRFVPSK